MKSIKVSDKFKDKVNQRCQQKYVTQKFLAEYVDMSLSTISSYLNCKKVFITTFSEISWALGFEDWKEIACQSNGDPLSKSNIDQLFSTLPHPVTEKCCQLLLKPGALLRIKAPRKRGKTTLALDILNDLRNQQSYRTASLSLDSADSNDYQDIHGFLKWFCLAIGNELNIPNQPTDSWGDSASKVKCTDYVERNFLVADNCPLVLCIDRLDRVFLYPEIAKDFFGLLRSWHEKAKSKERWQNLKLVLLYCTEADCRTHL